jgi:hypothetical protein
MNREETRLSFNSTWLPLAAVISICGAVFMGAWWARGLEAKVDYQAENLIDMRKEVADGFDKLNRKLDEQTTATAGLEKKIGSLSTGLEDSSLPLAKPAVRKPVPKQTVETSAPDGWTTDRYGHLYKLQ